MSIQVSSFPAPHPVSYLTGVAKVAYGVTLFCLQDLFFWQRLVGSKNPQADVLGPAYIPGAQKRNVAEGKGVMASLEVLRASPVVFLLYGQIKDSNGKGIFAELDVWQTDSNGFYYIFSDELRGKITTDAEGRFQILTVPVNAYGGRAAHYHMSITPSGPDADKKGRGITTQLYLCPANHPDPLNKDFVRFMRTPRYGNILQAWVVDGAKKPFFDLPTMAPGDAERDAMLNEWNGVLKDAGGLTVGAGARYDITL